MKTCLLLTTTLILFLTGCSNTNAPAPTALNTPTANGPALPVSNLQAQLNNAKDGDVITLPAGTYPGPFSIPHAITIKGEGDRKKVQLTGPGTTLVAKVNGVKLINLSISNEGPKGDGVFFQNCTGEVENCEFTSASESCVHAQGLQSGAKVTGCDISGGMAGVYAVGGGNIELVDCKIHNMGLWGAQSRTQDSKISLSNCKIYDCKDVGVHSVEGAGLSIINSAIYNNVCGISIRNGGKIEVKGCKIYDNTKEGIDLWDGVSGSVQNCELYRNDLAVGWSTSASLNISNNKIYSNKEYGLVARPNSAGTVSNNEVYENGLDGIALMDGAKPTVTENSFHNNTAGAFYVTGTGTCQFEQNEAYDNNDVRSERRNGAKTDSITNRLSANQKLWLLSLSAVIFERNQHRHDLVTGGSFSPDQIKIQQELLSKWWGATNKKELLERIDSLWKTGHRADFESAAKVIVPASDAQFDVILKQAENEATRRQWTLVRKYGRVLGNDGLLGWDLCRVAALARWGYLSGYITQDEAWSIMLRAGQKMQSVYKSGDEMGKVYCIGFVYWRCQFETLGTTPTDSEKAYLKYLGPPRLRLAHHPLELESYAQREAAAL